MQLLFPTPLLIYRIPDADAINAAILEEIDQRQKEDEGITRSNRIGWHSRPDFFFRKENAHRALANAVKQAIGHATASLSKNPNKEQLKLHMTGWINVNPVHGYNVPHDHPGSFWSGAYYIQVPTGDPDSDADREKGSISFIDHRSAPAGQGMVQAPQLNGSRGFRPEAGTLLVFPSGQRHWVHPNPGPEERVTMAFNAMVKVPGGGLEPPAPIPAPEKAETPAPNAITEDPVKQETSAPAAKAAPRKRAPRKTAAKKPAK
jgi:uncharacterized protein (TIGR02466 family)